eukprot:scaffold141346_cov39-Prasinocladus_malaysianus.AAC.1
MPTPTLIPVGQFMGYGGHKALSRSTWSTEGYHWIAKSLPSSPLRIGKGHNSCCFESVKCSSTA